MSKLKKTIEYLTYLLIFLLPWQTRWIFKINNLNNGYWEYGSLSLYFIDILLALIWVFGIIFILSKIKDEDFWLKIKKQKYLILFVSLFIVWLFISIIWSQDKILNLYWAVRIALLIDVAFILSLIKISFKKISLSLITAGVIQSILAIWQFFSQQVIASQWLGMAGQLARDLGVSVVEVGDQRWLRVYGSLPHPNILAGFLVITILLTIYLLDKYPSKVRYLSAVLPILILGLMLTFSRGAILALIISFIFYKILIKIKIKQNLINKSVLIGLVSVIIFSIFLYPLLMTRLQNQARLEVKSNQERIASLQQAKEIIQQNWLLGVGVGNYTLELHNLYPQQEVWWYQPAHNVYLLILSELGLVGLILFLSIIFYLVFQIFKSGLNSQKIIGLALLLSLLIIGLFDHYLWSMNCGLLLCGIILAIDIQNLSI
ncbi:MAG: O-antigen ligase family protein [Patescibacteria group bacterium]|nr:O-antigen ligase family protein [Patescibacteria group bacterium]